MKLAFLVSLLFLVGLGGRASAQVGFFSPGDLPPRAVMKKLQIGLVNAESPSHLQQNLTRADGLHFKVYIDIGSMIAGPTPVNALSMSYIMPNGDRHAKIFRPGPDVKLRRFLSDTKIRGAVDSIAPLLLKHRKNIGALFLIDEPYINGITKSELGHAAKVVRAELKRYGLDKIPIGAIFASGMFDRSFAHLIDRQSGAYVREIDSAYRARQRRGGAGFAIFAKALRMNRLVTYDRAGNMYVGGGLPKSLDVYGFDSYLSTALLDNTHSESMEWFYKKFHIVACATFANETMAQIRARLSFFPPYRGAGSEESYSSDRHVLDDMYQCRMDSVTRMLKRAAEGMRGKRFVLVSESSNNGVMEFNRLIAPASNQDWAVVARRVRDEVIRGEKFFASHDQFYTGGLLFFTYRNVQDFSIRLPIGGASTMPSVMRVIYEFADEFNSDEKRPPDAKAAVGPRAQGVRCRRSRCIESTQYIRRNYVK